MTKLELLVNPFGNLESEEPDDVQTPQFETDDAVEKAYNHYISLRKRIWIYDRMWIYERIVPVLSPSQINIFFRRFDEDEIGRINFAVYSARLIQESYDNGHNNFLIDVGDAEMTHFLQSAHGTLENPLKLTFCGNLEKYFASSARYFEAHVKGNAGESCGSDSNNCVFNIEGNAPANCGYHAENSVFNITGDASANCGAFSKKCNFNISGSSNDGLGEKAIDSKFKVAGDGGSGCGKSAEGCEFIVNGALGNDLGLYAQDCFFYFERLTEYRMNYRSLGSIRFKETDSNSKFKTPNWETYKALKKESHLKNAKLRFDYMTWLKRKLK